MKQQLAEPTNLVRWNKTEKHFFGVSLSSSFIACVFTKRPNMNQGKSRLLSVEWRFSWSKKSGKFAEPSPTQTPRECASSEKKRNSRDQRSCTRMFSSPMLPDCEYIFHFFLLVFAPSKLKAVADAHELAHNTPIRPLSINFSQIYAHYTDFFACVCARHHFPFHPISDDLRDQTHARHISSDENIFDRLTASFMSCFCLSFFPSQVSPERRWEVIFAPSRQCESENGWCKLHNVVAHTSWEPQSSVDMKTIAISCNYSRVC